VPPDSSERLTRLAREFCGLELGERRRLIADERLAALARAHGLDGVDPLLERLFGDPSGRLAALVLDAIVPADTAFFRDPRAFDALRTQLLPALIERRVATRRLDVWCAGVSTGQEAYSLLMLLRERFPMLLSWRIHCVATDAFERRVEFARAGRYNRIELNRGLEPRWIERYFRRSQGAFEIDADLRSAVDFRVHNLLRASMVEPGFDLVLLRHTLSHMTPSARESALRCVRSALRPDGFLMLGLGESEQGAPADFEETPRTLGFAFAPRAA
jgi:chemotaxis protein methyltransferase CheR